MLLLLSVNYTHIILFGNDVNTCTCNITAFQRVQVNMCMYNVHVKVRVVAYRYMYMYMYLYISVFYICFIFISDGNHRILQQLLSKGYNVNGIDQEGATALMHW